MRWCCGLASEWTAAMNSSGVFAGCGRALVLVLLLAVGAIANRVVPIETGDGVGIGVRPTVRLTLSCDHRVVDGARGAEFLRDVAEAIRNPDAWL